MEEKKNIGITELIGGKFRYVVVKGQLTGKQQGGVPSFVIENPLEYSNNFDDVRMLATKQFRKGNNVLIIDAAYGAMIGGMWCIHNELIEEPVVYSQEPEVQDDGQPSDALH